jgi:hypothetical protein
VLLIFAPVASAQYSSSAGEAQSMHTLVQDQYPNQGGYSRQGYNGPRGNSVLDHLTIEAGGGFTAPLGNTSTWQTYGSDIGLGGGWMFTPKIGLLAEYNFNRSSIPTATLNNLGEPDGNVHIWSFTLDPIIYLKQSGRLGSYATGGGGFYRKLTSFTEPVFIGYYCDFFYGCFPEYQNVVLSHFSSNQGGVNIGLGGTYRLSPDGKAKIFAEVRYVFVDSPKTSASSLGTGTVSMLPVNFGLRW